MWVCIKIRKAFFFKDAHVTPRSIVIITDSFEVLDLKTVLNKAVLQTANLSKVVKRRRRTKGTRKATERERERGGGWRAVAVDEEISKNRPDSWRDGGRGGQKWENE